MARFRLMPALSTHPPPSEGVAKALSPWKRGFGRGGKPLFFTLSPALSLKGEGVFRHPPSFPRKRESSAPALIPGLRFTPPGMTAGGGSFPAHGSALHASPLRHSRESGNPLPRPGFRVSVSTPPGMTAGDGSFPAHASALHASPLRHSRESGNPIPRHGFRVSVSLRPE